MNNAKNRFFGLLLPILSTACFNVATTESTLENVTFNFQSGYAFVDAKEARPAVKDGVLVFNDKKTQSLEIVLSGAITDPEQDPRFMPFAESQQRQRDIKLNGLLRLRITDITKMALNTPMAAGELFTVVAGNPALNEIDGEEEYPSSIRASATNSTATLQLSEAGRQNNEAVRGVFNLVLSRKDADPATAKTGSVTVTFAVPVITELVAECWDDEEVCEFAFP